ncbi:hypothetical protein F2P81_012394 [Scophthalmus maximus]|uniref:Uncharacterized protein n=1 Tax=Scophthalmus maximus TaxID=52904 RepID=A0A6A4SHJ0_SCOMX|nr:hypothetical protein F2P81_012394 [Scophthalmus maximus]
MSETNGVGNTPLRTDRTLIQTSPERFSIASWLCRTLDVLAFAPACVSQQPPFALMEQMDTAMTDAQRVQEMRPPAALVILAPVNTVTRGSSTLIRMSVWMTPARGGEDQKNAR